MWKAGSAVQRGDCRQRVEQVPERDVDARHDPLFAGRLEDVGETSALREVRDDRQLARRRIALGRIRMAESIVLEADEAGDPLANRRLESRELRPDVQPLEHRAGLAIERKGAAAQAIGVAGGGNRRRGFELRCRHCRSTDDFATAAPVGRFRADAPNRLIPFTYPVRGACTPRRSVIPDVENVSADSNRVIEVQCWRMTEAGELGALKAALRGAVSNNEQIGALLERVEPMETDQSIDEALLADLARISAAHALASHALRGLVNTMLSRRGLPAPER